MTRRSPADGFAVVRHVVGPAVIDAITLAELLDALAAAAERRTGLTVAYLNAHGFLTAARDPGVAALLPRFDLVVCDGVGLRRALRFLGAPVPERMTPPDFVDELARRSAAAGRRLFLLGDEPGVAARAAARLEAGLPGVVAGTHHGFYRPEEQAAVADAIAASEAGVVLVGMGMPRQERAILELRDRLPGRVLMAVGGLFRWIAGVETRGPRWLTDHGFEWLCRLAAQPRRVAGRYLVGLPRFAACVLRLRLAGAAPVHQVRAVGAAPPAGAPARALVAEAAPPARPPRREVGHA
jgi:N-acetylglucosaminyldiphosphoundecaprenol N-acetyl-beta-D-mannosaminyltransferase